MFGIDKEKKEKLTPTQVIEALEDQIVEVKKAQYKTMKALETKLDKLCAKEYKRVKQEKIDALIKDINKRS